MAIEKGEYVRILYLGRLTQIAKITKILEKDPGYHNMQMYQIDINTKHDGCSYWSNKIYREDIIKHSRNIGDLIKKGDYVNGEYVIWVNKYIIHTAENDYKIYETDGIESVITKEQMKHLEYRLEE